MTVALVGLVAGVGLAVSGHLDTAGATVVSGVVAAFCAGNLFEHRA